MLLNPTAGIFLEKLQQLNVKKFHCGAKTKLAHRRLQHLFLACCNVRIVLFYSSASVVLCRRNSAVFGLISVAFNLFVLPNISRFYFFIEEYLLDSQIELGSQDVFISNVAQNACDTSGLK